jgi:hypothetical protein
MKLETSQDLLNRVRAKHGASWYGLQKLLDVHKNTVYSWKGGHTIVDRKFAPRIAELLGESAEYVLACLEAEREQSAEVLKLWRRIAERFRSTASILLVGLVGVGAGALPVQHVRADERSDAPRAVYYGKSRPKLGRCLKTMVDRSLQFLAWTRARIASTGFPWRCCVLSPAPT